MYTSKLFHWHCSKIMTWSFLVGSRHNNYQQWSSRRPQDGHPDRGSTRTGTAAGLRFPRWNGSLWPRTYPRESGACQGCRWAEQGLVVSRCMEEYCILSYLYLILSCLTNAPWLWFKPLWIFEVCNIYSHFLVCTQCIGYDCTACMGYMDPDVGPQKSV